MVLPPRRDSLHHPGRSSLTSKEGSENASDTYDIAVVGSGIGGLTCAAFLARAGMRVLVLEQHSAIGGYAHGFRRRGFTFDAAVHSVPMGDNGFVCHLLKLLGIRDLVKTVAQPDVYQLRTPDFYFALPAERTQMRDSLLERFPHEKAGVDKMLGDLRTFYEAIAAPLFRLEDAMSSEDTAFVSQYHNRSFQSLIDGYFTDPRLRQCFYSVWPYVGASPDYAASLFSAMTLTTHVLEGTHYCEGGFANLAAALASTVVAGNGSVLTDRRVTGIDIDGGKASGVRTAGGRRFAVRAVVSNVSPYLVHRELLPEEWRSRRFLRRLGNLRPSVSGVSVYLGMAPRYEQILPANVLFSFSNDDYAGVFRRILEGRACPAEHLMFLSPPAQEGKPTLTLLRYCEKRYSQNWNIEKMRAAEVMLDQAEALFPGLRDCIEVMEVGSPETFERYTGNTDGAFYGFENTRLMYGEAKLSNGTHIPNLYQTGQWVRHGASVWNVMASGYLASKLVANSL